MLTIVVIQAFNLVVTRSLKLRMAQVLPLSPWLTLDIGEQSSSSSEVTVVLILDSFAERVMQAMKGKTGIVEPTYVYLPGVAGGEAIAKKTGCDFFSVPVELDQSGAAKATDIIGSANEYEQKLLQKCYEGLKGNISKGVEFIQNPPK